ncbi:GNAT family N-acetyltransferase [Bacillus salacetis]|uniref:GNAT family N-acetyltransferase n=1 Tax=Bacillus salacetis TaxID=2315464 RepID=UPI003BA1EBCC
MNLHINGQVFTLKKAGDGDMDKVISLLVDAARWLKTKGTTQWDYYITDLEGNLDEIIESITKRSTYLLQEDAKAVATFTLEEDPNEWDMDVWGEDASQNDCVYLHRLVVNREYAGRGIGDALMEWAKEDVSRRGKKYIRFDCLNNNEGLNHYYQRQYRLKGVANIYGKHSLYEITL